MDADCIPFAGSDDNRNSSAYLRYALLLCPTAALLAKHSIWITSTRNSRWNACCFLDAMDHRP